MNEMDWPPNDMLALQIVQRLAVAVASIEVLSPTRPEYPTDTSALRAARDLAVSIRSAIDAGAAPGQMEEHVRRYDRGPPEGTEGVGHGPVGLPRRLRVER